MAQLRPTVQKIFRAVPNMALRNAENEDVQAFLEATTRTTIERALTEFSARICYNSVRKMGSSPNFVEKILQSGHLSTAEHASLMFPTAFVVRPGNRSDRHNEIFRANRFFDLPKGFVAGNLRSWFEYMAVGQYSVAYEFIVSTFPDVFPGTTFLDPKELYEFSEQTPISVPAYEHGLDGKFNLYLLAVNYGELAVSHRPNTVLHSPWVRYTWLIEGVSRSLTHQLVRHRGASFSQESQRYVDFEKGQLSKKYLPFVYPESFSAEQRDKLYWMYNQIEGMYEDLREDERKEDARFILPNGASTRLVCSFNTKELLHFLNIRCAKDAQWEIRRLAMQMLNQAYLATPIKEFKELITKYDGQDAKD